jgi:hypothetical protein
MSFQQDLKLTFELIHKQYIDSYKEFITGYNFEKSTTVENASGIVFNLKQYSNLIKEITQLFKCEQLEELETTEDIIENELQKKMLPIMMLYRHVLEVKYSVSPT